MKQSDKLTKEEFTHYILSHLEGSKPIACSFDCLKEIFGKPVFTRVDGLEFMLAKLNNSNVTEEQMSFKYPGLMEVHKNIEDWAKDNNIYGVYDLQKDIYYFHKIPSKNIKVVHE